MWLKSSLDSLGLLPLSGCHYMDTSNSTACDVPQFCAPQYVSQGHVVPSWHLSLNCLHCRQLSGNIQRTAQPLYMVPLNAAMQGGYTTVILVYSYTQTAKISLDIFNTHAAAQPFLPSTQPRSALFVKTPTHSRLLCGLQCHFSWPPIHRPDLISPPGRSHCWWTGMKSKPSQPSVRPYSTRHRRSRTCYGRLVLHWCSYFDFFPLQRCLWLKTELDNAPGPSIPYKATKASREGNKLRSVNILPRER